MILVCFTEKKAFSDEFIKSSYRAYCRINGKSAEDVTVDRDEGKPFLITQDGARSDVYFSLSHSGKFTACAVSDKNIGFDIQQHRDLDFSVMSGRLFGEEIAEKNAFFDRYSQGEARAKLDNEGLFKGLKEGGGVVYRIFDGYSMAICGGTDPVFFTELYIEND